MTRNRNIRLPVHFSPKNIRVTVYSQHKKGGSMPPLSGIIFPCLLKTAVLWEYLRWTLYPPGESQAAIAAATIHPDPADWPVPAQPLPPASGYYFWQIPSFLFAYLNYQICKIDKYKTESQYFCCSHTVPPPVLREWLTAYRYGNTKGIIPQILLKSKKIR